MTAFPVSAEEARDAAGAAAEATAAVSAAAAAADGDLTALIGGAFAKRKRAGTHSWQHRQHCGAMQNVRGNQETSGLYPSLARPPLPLHSNLAWMHVSTGVTVLAGAAAVAAALGALSGRNRDVIPAEQRFKRVTAPGTLRLKGAASLASRPSDALRACDTPRHLGTTSGFRFLFPTGSRPGFLGLNNKTRGQVRKTMCVQCGACEAVATWPILPRTHYGCLSTTEVIDGSCQEQMIDLEATRGAKKRRSVHATSPCTVIVHAIMAERSYSPEI